MAGANYCTTNRVLVACCYTLVILLVLLSVSLSHAHSITAGPSSSSASQRNSQLKVSEEKMMPKGWYYNSFFLMLRLYYNILSCSINHNADTAKAI